MMVKVADEVRATNIQLIFHQHLDIATTFYLRGGASRSLDWRWYYVLLPRTYRTYMVVVLVHSY